MRRLASLCAELGVQLQGVFPIAGHRLPPVVNDEEAGRGTSLTQTARARASMRGRRRQGGEPESCGPVKLHQQQ